MNLYLCYVVMLYPSLLSCTTIWSFNSLISCSLQAEMPPVLRYHCKFGDDVSYRCLQQLPLFCAETLIPKISSVTRLWCLPGAEVLMQGTTGVPCSSGLAQFRSIRRDARWCWNLPLLEPLRRWIHPKLAELQGWVSCNRFQLGVLLVYSPDLRWCILYLSHIILFLLWLPNFGMLGRSWYTRLLWKHREVNILHSMCILVNDNDHLFGP